MAKLKTIVLFGQSNADGNALMSELPSVTAQKWAGLNSLTTIPLDLEIPGIHYWTAKMPNGSAYSGTSTSGSTTTLTDSGATFPSLVGQWVVITSGSNIGQARQISSNTGTQLTWLTPMPFAVGTDPYVVSGTTGSLSLASYTGEFRKLRFYNNTTPPTSLYYQTGFDYSNHRTRPLMSPAEHTAVIRFGPDLELAWQMQHEIEDDIWVIKLGIGSSYMSKYVGPTLGYNAYSWFDGGLVHNDWIPGSTDKLTSTATYDLFDILVETIIKGAAKSWVQTNRPNDSIDIIGIFCKEGESDSVTETRANLTYVNMRMIRDTMRKRIADAGLSSYQADRIPFIIAGHDTAIWPYAGTTNGNFKRLANDDPYTGYVETTGMAYNTGDAAHLNAVSQVLLGQYFYAKWVEIRDRESRASTLERDRLKLSDLRTKVLRRYERNGVSNEASSTLVDQFINDSLRELYNTIGNNAWFLRRIEQVDVTSAAGGVFTPPRVIDILERIERPDVPGQQIKYVGMGYTDNGLLQIMLPNSGPGVYNIHHLIEPKDLVKDGDYCLVPNAYIEMVVMLACKRLAESAGSESMAAYYIGETERLYKFIKRDCMRHMRHQQATIRVAGQDDVTSWEYFDNL